MELFVKTSVHHKHTLVSISMLFYIIMNANQIKVFVKVTSSRTETPAQFGGDDSLRSADWNRV